MARLTPGPSPRGWVPHKGLSAGVLRSRFRVAADLKEVVHLESLAI